MVDCDLNIKYPNKINSKLKGASITKTLEKITKQDMSYLIKKGILRLNKQGNYGDNLIVCGNKGSKYGHYSQNSQHRSKHKQRFTTNYIYNKLLESQKQDINDTNLDNIKENQRYLFNDGSNSRLGVS